MEKELKNPSPSLIQMTPQETEEKAGSRGRRGMRGGGPTKQQSVHAQQQEKSGS